MASLPTDPREIKTLTDTIAGDVLASGARTVPAVRKVARESLATLRPDLFVVVTVDHASGFIDIDIRDKRRKPKQ